jgi:hypothetical protein
VQSDAHREGDATPGSQHPVQRPHGVHDLEPRVHGAPGIVLVGERIPEVHEQTVAQVLRHMPLEAVDRVGADLVVGADDLAQLLGVEVARELGEAHEVAEHDRELPALGASSRVP